MLKELIDRTTRGAVVAIVAAVALAAGIVVGGSALGAGVDQIRTVVAGGPSAKATDSPGGGLGHGKADQKRQSGQDERGRSDEKAAKPNTAAAGAAGVHGRCVSAIARDKKAVGGPHDNHGWAVSRAARTCPHPTPSASGGS